MDEYSSEYYSRSNMSNSFNNYYYSEDGFAEEYYRRRSGVVWPPRCYACSFCKREFRSAQALGGHMNVHRRDRARLKQSLITPQNETLTKSLSKPHKLSSGSKSVVFSQLAYSPAIKELAGRKVSSPPVGISMDVFETMHSKRYERSNMEVGLRTSSIEDIDLELRLGYPPAVK